MAIVFLILGIVIGYLLAVLLKQTKSASSQTRRYSIMSNFVIADDTPDGRFSFAVTASDAEGNPITDPTELAKLQREVVNSNPDAFAMTQDADNPDAGDYHVGNPGQSNVTVNLKDADGNLLATNTDGFTVTTGKVALGSVTTSFDGLTPAP